MEAGRKGARWGSGPGACDVARGARSPRRAWHRAVGPPGAESWLGGRAGPDEGQQGQAKGGAGVTLALSQKPLKSPVLFSLSARGLPCHLTRGRRGLRGQTPLLGALGPVLPGPPLASALPGAASPPASRLPPPSPAAARGRGLPVAPSVGFLSTGHPCHRLVQDGSS